MAKSFTSWTVLPHRPIEKLEPNLWRVEGKMPDGKTQRAMVVARMNDGGLLIYNAIALGDDEMREIESLGVPRILLVPNGFHRQDARIYKLRYPELKVVCPKGARKRVEQVVSVDATIDEVPGDENVSLVHVEGVKDREAVMTVRSNGNASLVFCDVVLNVPPIGGVMGFMLSPSGRPSVPRLMRLLWVKDRGRMAGHLDRLASTPGLVRICVGHGVTITERPAETLRAVAQELSA
jgi:hypothetical protein